MVSLLECWLAGWIAWLLDALNAWWLGRVAAKCLLDSLVLGYLDTWILGYLDILVTHAYVSTRFLSLYEACFIR